MTIDEQNIIDILGIQSLPDGRKLAILEKASSLVEKRMMVRMVKELDPSGLEEFGAMLDKNDPEALQSFITTKFPNFQEWLVEEINAVKTELGALV